MSAEQRAADRTAGAGLLTTLGVLGAILATGALVGALWPRLALGAAALLVVSLALAGIGAAVARWAEP